jgi:deazaflavin-dependent oxidoreductase (nitroreductase family)
MQPNEPQVLYLTTKGWKTGRAHQIEIWFVHTGGLYYVVSEFGSSSHWVQNIKHNSSVSFRVDSDTLEGAGRIVNVKSEPKLRAKVCELMEHKYHWSAGLIVELAPTKRLVQLGQ